jgi:hypothetical protein
MGLILGKILQRRVEFFLRKIRKGFKKTEAGNGEWTEFGSQFAVEKKDA